MLLALLLNGTVLAQVKPETQSLVVNGHSGEAAVVRINDKTYVELQDLARIGNGDLGFRGSQISLAFPGSSATPPAESVEQEKPAPKNGLSRNFMMAGIETIAQMREWASAMAYAIRNGYGVTEDWAGDYRQKAAASLDAASSSASTDADHNALQLLTNEFNSVGTWSNNLVEAKKSMDTAKYSTSPNALRDEPLSQKIINCGRFLSRMLGSAEYADDPSCH